jgi:hypothetical protein
VDDPFAVLAKLGGGVPDATLHRRLHASFREHLERRAEQTPRAGRASIRPSG